MVSPTASTPPPITTVKPSSPAVGGAGAPPRVDPIQTVKPGPSNIPTVKPNGGPVKGGASTGFEKPLNPGSANGGLAPSAAVGGLAGAAVSTPVRSDPTFAKPVSEPPPNSVACNGPDDDNWYVNIGIGVGGGFGFGFGYGSGYYEPTWGGCFSYCAPYAYPDPFCYRPWYYGPSYWACDPWGGWYARSWWYWPSYWGYPSCHYRSYPGGTWWNIRYSGWCDDWAFRFAYTPCYTYDSCGLVSSSVYASSYDYGIPFTAEISPWSYSTHGLYKWTFIPSGTVSVPMAETIVTPEPSIAPQEPGLPSPATAEQLRGSSDRQLADVYLRLDDISSAIRVYLRHIAAYPGDVDAVRSLGVAYLFTDQVGAGLDQIERAYRIDPTLATRPFSKTAIEPARMVQAIDAAAQAAAMENSAKSWLAVCVMMQADGRVPSARTALDKAAAAGLNEQVASNLRGALPVGVE